jgi:hypothetical protein
MTSDQNSPVIEQASQGAPPQSSQQESLFGGSSNTTHGMGQSKSSRRRRRKRKSKTEGDPGNPAPASDQSAIIGSVQAAAQPAEGGFRPQNNPSSGFQQQSNQPGGAASGGKRWKKKFRDRQRTGGSFDNSGGSQSGDQGVSINASSGSPRPSNGSNGGSRSNGGGFRSADTHQFGNNASSKRKSGSFSGGGGKQRDRGPRSFVGPMDHSYRAVNGNFAETPPSTIETHSNGNYQGRSHSARQSYQSDSQPIDYSQGRAIPIAEDAPTKIVFFIEDLFFLAKIQETARKLGVKVAFMKNEKESIATLTAAEEADRPGLIVFDLNNANAKPLTLIPKLKTKLKKSTSIIGFLSHLQGDLKAKAVEAGCDTVMPRSAFSQNLPNLLRRYGIIEEEEPNYNM